MLNASKDAQKNGKRDTVSFVQN